ncbi:MAG: EscU/YscU/HrcU family type III secretion system export apparatus switch protein [Alphaproteobacteria bacterium]|nr:EscU/YscU/HrcU family type III secretion system export apparatus switch protein [Alphaproteobacteria bacterium]
MNDDKPSLKDVAVALAYEKGEDAAPRVVAKGRGLIAQRIVELAGEHGVVIDTNPELAEALSRVELDELIPVELYKAVAEVIGYVLRTREKMR